MHHGFVLDDNPHDCVQIAVGIGSLPPRPSKEAQGKAAAAAQDHLARLSAVAEAEQQWREAEARFLRRRAELRQRGVYRTEAVFCISPHAAEGQEEAGGVPQELWQYLRVIHDIPDTNSFEPRRRLAELCQRRLQGYPTSIEEDEELLARDVSTFEQEARGCASR